MRNIIWLIVPACLFLFCCRADDRGDCGCRVDSGAAGSTETSVGSQTSADQGSTDQSTDTGDATETDTQSADGDTGTGTDTDTGGSDLDDDACPTDCESVDGDAEPAGDTDTTPVDGDTEAAADAETVTADGDCPTDCEEAAAVLTAVSPADLNAEMAHKDFLLINVHIPYAGEIPGTDVHISYEAPEDIAAYVGTDKSKKVVVYCLSNYMSGIAGRYLVDRGYTAVRFLDGGISAWKAAGYPFTDPAR